MSFQRKRSYLCAFLVDRQSKNNQSKETKSTKTYEKDPQKTPKNKQTYKQTHLIKIQKKAKVCCMVNIITKSKDMFLF